MSARFTSQTADASTRRTVLIGFGAISGAAIAPAAFAQNAEAVAPQPYFASVQRALGTLARLGSAISPRDSQALGALANQSNATAVQAAEQILAPYTLAHVTVDSHGLPSAQPGGAERVLIEQGWRLFLLRISNPSGIATGLSVTSSRDTPGRLRPGINARTARILDTIRPVALIQGMWLLSQLTESAPLSGAAVEYRVIQLFSRDRGARRAQIAFGAGGVGQHDQASTDSAIQSNRVLDLDFQCLPSQDVRLRIRDADGSGCMASLIIRDEAGRVYPPQLMRLAPDMAFHAQVYRADGETVRVPEGAYTVESARGPEYLKGRQSVSITGSRSRINVDLQRWIDPAQWGWYSGDTHLHASGCSHYDNPTQGVSPETMIRHIRGEALSIGEVLTWAAGFDYQRQFNTGHAISPAASLEHPELQAANNATFTTRATPQDSHSLLRYDIEVSGMPSSHAGHLALLRLSDINYPGASTIEDWPSWTLPILQWAKAQGGIVGYAHCSIGMYAQTDALPNYEIPPFTGGGTTAAIVDVTHDAVDFLNGCNRAPVAELNAWYHMLNCGFRLAMAGETDYPCLLDERPGLGRSYVKSESRPTDDAGYDSWVSNLKRGRLYCGDGRSHFLDFKIGGRSSGDEDVVLERPGSIEISALIAARLEPQPTAETEAIRNMSDDWPQAGWHIERARIGATRNVKVEVVVNGYVAGETEILADGSPQAVRLSAPIERSSWVALRVYPSGHTHPIFVRVGDRPVRASRRSAQWCRSCVDKLWEVKSPFIRDSEKTAAAEAFDHARRTYDAIHHECEVE